MKRAFLVPRQYHIRKKVRGAKRRMQSLGNRLGVVLENIADENFERDKVLHYHLPDPSKLVDSTSSPRSVRKRFVQLLIDELVQLDDRIKGRCQALLIVSIPFLSQSRIDVCLDSRRFQGLIDETAASPSWVAADPRNVIKELNLALPSEYRVKGFLRDHRERGERYTEENWIIWK